jgi:hypothetical protein
MTVSISGSRKNLDCVLQKLLRNKKIRIIAVLWETENMENAGVKEYVEGERLV